MVSWSQDGRLLASGDAEGRIRLWAMTQSEPVSSEQTLMDHASYVGGLAFAPDGCTLASGGWDGTVTADFT